jgi:dTDP-4-dehydrorhamnose reductase
LKAGRPFTVWESDSINMVATPSLATECGEIMLEIGARKLTGVFHCSGADAVSRRQLAELTCDVFDLDAGLLRYAEPPPSAMPPGGSVPYDTSLTTPRTDELLERTATPVRTLLSRFRREYEM